jgi:Carboxypeptidase regulatory-like domain
MMFKATVGGPEGSGEAESAVLPISVAGDDLTNLMIITSKGATALGRLTLEGTSTPPALSGVRITSVSTEGDGPGLAPGGGATAKADGSFELKGLSGRRLIRAANLPQGWTFKAARLNGEDITDTGAEFKPGQEVSGLEIVATSKQTEIAGGVTASNGSPIKDYTVVIFSEDPQHWTLPMTRWVTGTRPDQEGRFRIRNMPAGTYYGVAVEYVEQGGWGDPELLDRLKGRAKRFNLDEGKTATLDLKLTDQY